MSTQLVSSFEVRSLINTSVLIVVLFIGTLILSGCGKSQGDLRSHNYWGANSKSQVPTKKQLELSKETFPQSLVDIRLSAVDKSAAKSSTGKSKIGSRDRHLNQDIPIGLNQNQSLDFDPFLSMSDALEGQENSVMNLMCGNGNHYYYNYIGVSNSLCLVAISKLALNRGISLYSGFSHILPSIAEKLFNENNAKGVDLIYHNTSVKSYGANGLKIRVFWDDCIAQLDNEAVADPQAFEICNKVDSSSIYYRVLLYPNSPSENQPDIDVEQAIGKMAWTVDASGFTEGEMIVSRNLMTIPDLTLIDYVPKQMQFEFKSDAEGNFKDILIKIERNLDLELHDRLNPDAWPDYTHQWDANVFRIKRIPATQDQKAMWTVQGSTNFLMHIGNPFEVWNKNVPTVTAEEEGRMHAITDYRIVFSAVAEDVFSDGRAVFDAVLVDGPGLDPSAYPESSWSQEFHISAAIKKAMKAQYTEEHYLTEHKWNGVSLIRTFDTDTGKPIRNLALEGHTDGVYKLAISNDGHYLASASDDNTLRVWNVNPASPFYKAQVLSLPITPVNEKVHSLSFNPVDGDLLAIGYSNGDVDILHIGFESNQFSLDSGLNDAENFKLKATWSSDGARLVTASDTGVKIWDMTNGNLVAELTENENQASRSAVFHPTDSTKVLAGYETGEILFWDLLDYSSPYARRSAGGSGAIIDITYTPDGENFLTVEEPNILQVWNATVELDPQTIKLYRFRKLNTDDITVGSDGDTLYFKSDNEVYTYSLSTGSTVMYHAGLNSTTSPSGVNSFVLHPDETAIIVGHNGAPDAPELGVDIEKYSLTTGVSTPVFTDSSVQGHNLGTEINSLVYSNNGAWILSGGDDNKIVLANAENGEFIREFNGHTAEVLSVSFNSDNTRILSSGADGTARVWDVDTGLELSFSPITHSASAIHIPSAIFSKDESLIITAGVDGTVKGWDAVTGLSSGYITSIRNNKYIWQQSAGNPNEYYLFRIDNVVIQNPSDVDPGGIQLSDGNPFLSIPDEILVSNSNLVSNTIGQLQNGEWGFGDNDGLGFNTIYVNTDASDPDLLPLNAIEMKHMLSINHNYFSKWYPVKISLSGADDEQILVSGESSWLSPSSSNVFFVNNFDAPICTFEHSFAQFFPNNNRIGTLTHINIGDDFDYVWDSYLNVVLLDNQDLANFCEVIASTSTAVDGSDFFVSQDGNRLAIEGMYSELNEFLYYEPQYGLIEVYDTNPSSSLYLQLLPNGSIIDKTSPSTEHPRKYFTSALSPVGSQLATAERQDDGYDPSWIDFDGRFKDIGYTIWWYHFGDFTQNYNNMPDENDVVNPYYVEPSMIDLESNNNADSWCYDYFFDTENQDNSYCKTSCYDVGGCYQFSVLSSYDINVLGRSEFYTFSNSSEPFAVINVDNFIHLEEQLNLLPPAWKLEPYVEKVIE